MVVQAYHGLLYELSRPDFVRICLLDHPRHPAERRAGVAVQGAPKDNDDRGQWSNPGKKHTVPPE